MNIQIPFTLNGNNHQLNINGLDIYIDDMDTSYKAITKDGLTVTTKIGGASITGDMPSAANRIIKFRIYFEGNSNTPIMSGSMTSFRDYSMPVAYYAFDTIFTTTQNTKFTWKSINLPNSGIWVKIYQEVEGLDLLLTEQGYPILDFNISNITYNSAQINLLPMGYEDFQALVLFKENGNDERIKLIEQTTTSAISLTDLEMGTTYVVWLDGQSGLSNFLRFSTLGAPMWVKTNNGYKEGKLWVRESVNSPWVKAKNVFTRNSILDDWKKSI